MNKATERHILNGFWVTYCPYCTKEHYLRSLSATEKTQLTLSKEDLKAVEDIVTGKVKSTRYEGEEYLKRIEKMVKKQAD